MNEQLKRLYAYLRGERIDSPLHQHDYVTPLVIQDAAAECENPAAVYIAFAFALKEGDEWAWSTLLFHFLAQHDDDILMRYIDENEWQEWLEKLTAISPWPSSYLIAATAIFDHNLVRKVKIASAHAFSSLVEKMVPRNGYSVGLPYNVLVRIPHVISDAGSLHTLCQLIIHPPWSFKATPLVA